MKKLLSLSNVMILALLLLVGCSSSPKSSPPQIAAMSLSASQQEIVDLFDLLDHEILQYEYTLSEEINVMEIWVEIYHYGKLLTEVVRLQMFDSDAPLNKWIEKGDGKLTIIISRFEKNEFRWTMSSLGGRSVSDLWSAEEDDHMFSIRGAITAPVPITNGKEIILYISRFTTGNALRSMNGDLQHYLEHPEELADNTYVHVIKARFTEKPFYERQ